MGVNDMGANDLNDVNQSSPIILVPNRPHIIEPTQAKFTDVDTGALSSDSTTHSELEIKYPEGGLRAWLVVFGSWCALFASLGIMNSLGTYQTYVSTHQLSDYSNGAIGWIFSLFTFMAWFCGILIGPLFDKYGPRWLILIGSVCIVASMMVLGECTG